MLAFIPGLGVPELLIILLILVLLFGANKLPQLLGGLGEGIRNFKRGMKEDEGKDRLEEPQRDRT